MWVPWGGYSMKGRMSVSHVSRICITWREFLYSRFRSHPIWPPKEIVQKTMSGCFRDMLLHSRVITDCTGLFIEISSLVRPRSFILGTSITTLQRGWLVLHPLAWLRMCQTNIQAKWVIKQWQKTVELFLFYTKVTVWWLTGVWYWGRLVQQGY